MKSRRLSCKTMLLCMALVVPASLPLISGAVETRYGDVVMNNFSERRGIAPVVFPHSIHRVHFRCNVCHGELGFDMKAGANKIEMSNIIQGQYCGACHNGKLAWGAASCQRCHRGPPTP